MRGELYCADAAGRTDHVKRSGYQEKEFTWDTQSEPVAGKGSGADMSLLRGCVLRVSPALMK